MILSLLDTSHSGKYSQPLLKICNIFVDPFYHPFVLCVRLVNSRFSTFLLTWFLNKLLFMSWISFNVRYTSYVSMRSVTELTQSPLVGFSFCIFTSCTAGIQLADEGNTVGSSSFVYVPEPEIWQNIDQFPGTKDVWGSFFSL